jgi:regulator of protease activity HflC (stomatin/prohibitin superfamily)
MATLQSLLSWVFNFLIWWVIVAPWEQALRVRMGKKVEVLEAGIHLRIPYLDVVYTNAIRRRTVDIGTQTLTTSDGEPLTLAGNVQYRIVDLLTLYQTLHDPGATIIDLAASHIADFVTTHTKKECSPEAIREYATEELDLSQYGLNDSYVNITDFAFVPTLRLITDDRQYRGSGVFDMSPDSTSLD